MKRNKFRFAAAICAVFFCLGLAAGAQPEAEFSNAAGARDSLILAVIRQSIDHRYAAAESAAVELIRRFPESAAGYFFRAGVVNSMMVDYEDSFREEDFYAYAEKAVEIAEAGIERDPGDPWPHFYRGGALGYIAFNKFRTGSYFQAFTRGMQSVGELKRAVELDSTLYDAYLGLGSYKYWVSRRTEFLRWTPFVSDRREEGLAMMREAMEKGRYSYESAASGLGWALIDAERYEEAVAVAEKVLELHPDSRFFQFIKARAWFKMERWEEAVEAYRELLANIRRGERNNGYNEVIVLSKLSVSLVELKRYDEAAEYCFAGLELPLSDDIRKRKRGDIKTLKECRRVILGER